MKKHRFIFVCLVLATAGASCNSVPPLTEYANEPRTFSEVLSYTPIVVVGTIAGPQSYLGHYRQSRWGSPPPPEHTVQLVRVTVNVETVLRSDAGIPKGNAAIYYFLWGVEHSYIGPPRLGSWNVGDRFMFFLRRERGYLRTICDQYKGCAVLQVFSGAHPGFQTYASPRSLIDLLITPGTGAGDEQMMRAIQTIGGAADIDPEYTVEKLKRLIPEGTPPIAAAACGELKQLLDQCVPSPWNHGIWMGVCNERSNLNLPCPGPCCGYGEEPIKPPGGR